MDELPQPNTLDVQRACQEFDDDNAIAELALDELFGAYPTNTVEWQVLLKVVTLNRLYSTNILDVHGLAKRICEIGDEVDKSLQSASPNIVDRVARLGLNRIEYSFASKYCSRHNPEQYPIWDSRARRYLLRIRRRSALAFMGRNPDLWDHYREYVDMINSLRSHYHLACSVRDLDKFFYKYGSAPEMP